MATAWLPVAPTDHADERNRIREPLQPVAAWQLADHHFAFDSSALLPSMATDLADLIALATALPGCPLSIFGHADPTGEKGYNKLLSGRRAVSLYGLLTRQPALWKELAGNPMGSDDWKKNGAIAAMREYLAGRGVSGALQLSGTDLYQRYMDAVGVDASGNAFSLGKDRFLGRGEDARGKADYQGCGEFNLLVNLSSNDAAAFASGGDKAARNEANAPNRRVTVFLFPAGTRISLDRWPCPRAGEGVKQCEKRLWSDAKVRMSNQARRREHPADRDTFACRFYDRLGPDSVPNTRRPLLVQLHDPAREPVPNADVEIDIGGAEPLRAVTDQRGWLRCQVPSRLAAVTVRYTPASTGAEYRVVVRLPKLPDQVDRYLAHIANFGFARDEAPGQQAVLKFQAAESLPLTGVIDDATREAVDRRLATALKDAEAPGGQ